MKKIAAVLASLVLVGGLSSCAKATEPYQDAPTSGQRNDSEAVVGTMPDGFSNFASKCDGPNRVYVLFHGDSAYGSIDVVPNDPRCTGATGQ